MADLIQEARLAVLEKKKHYDPARGTIKSFVHRQGEWAISQVLRYSTRQKRDHRKCVPLIPETDFRHADGAPSATIADDGSRRADLSIDVHAVVTRLEPALRALCHRLLSEHPADIAASEPTHRSTLYRRMGRIRAIFEKSLVSY